MVFLAGSSGFFLLLVLSFVSRLWRWWRHEHTKNQISRGIRHQEASRLEEGAGVGQDIELKKVDIFPRTP